MFSCTRNLRCEKRFVRNSSLERHIRAVHVERCRIYDYKHPICHWKGARAFTRKITCSTIYAEFICHRSAIHSLRTLVFSCSRHQWKSTVLSSNRQPINDNEQSGRQGRSQMLMYQYASQYPRIDPNGNAFTRHPSTDSANRYVREAFRRSEKTDESSVKECIVYPI